MSGAVAVRSAPLERFRADVFRQQGEIAKALAGRLNPDYFLRVLMTTARNTPKLMECDGISLLSSVMEAAQLGLPLDGLLGQAYLVPYYDKKTQGYRAQCIPGYRGYITLMRRGGGVRDVMAACIHENDEYEVLLGTDGYVRHRPNLMGDRGPVIASYAVAQFQDGGRTFRVVTSEELLTIQEAARKKQKDKAYGPWFEHYPAMCEKTAIRRVAKFVPIVDDGAAEAQRYADIEDRIEVDAFVAPSAEDPEPADDTQQVIEAALKPPEES